MVMLELMAVLCMLALVIFLLSVGIIVKFVKYGFSEEDKEKQWLNKTKKQFQLEILILRAKIMFCIFCLMCSLFFYVSNYG